MFSENYEKMADVNNDPFGDHNKIDLHPDTGENFPLTKRRVMGGSTWETESEQETSSGGGKTQERKLTDSYIDSLYKELFKHYCRTLDATHQYNIRRKDN